MSLFGALVRTAVNIASLPVAAVNDVITLECLKREVEEPTK